MPEALSVLSAARQAARAHSPGALRAAREVGSVGTDHDVCHGQAWGHCRNFVGALPRNGNAAEHSGTNGRSLGGHQYKDIYIQQ